MTNLAAALADRYRIERKLGAGGMAPRAFTEQWILVAVAPGNS